MRRVFTILLFLLRSLFCVAQVITNPVFDRTDDYSFHVEKVELTQDTTFVFCSLYAEENSWASISSNMFLENVRDGKRYPVLKVSGIPMNPEKRYFECEEIIQVVLYFPHVSAERINLIEIENETAFNVYGIDLNCSYETSYTSKDIHNFYSLAQDKEKEEDWSAAIDYSLKQLDASNYVEGLRSYASACSIYNLVMEYAHTNQYEIVVDWGKKAIDILREFPQDSLYLDLLARTYGNVGTAYFLLKQPDFAAEYMELSLATRRLKDGVGVLNYEEYLTEMAKMYYYVENYPKALLYGLEIVDIYEKKYRDNPYKYGCNYLRSLNNLCEYYQCMGNTEEAVDFGIKAVDLINKCGCDDYSILYETYNNLGSALLNNGQIDEGITILESILERVNAGKWNLSTRLLLASTYLCEKNDTMKALQGYEALLKEMEDSTSSGNFDFLVYTKVLNCLYEINRWTCPNIAMQYLEKAIKKHKEWYGEGSVAYANMLLKKIDNIWIESLSDKKLIDSLLLYTRQATDIVKRHITNSSVNMSKNDRQVYWQRYKAWFTWFIPTISCLANTDIGNSLAYDAALFYKGMLLSSETEFKNVVLTSCDDELCKLYHEYTNNLSLLEKSYSVNSVVDSVDSLESIIRDEEYLLSQKVTRFNHQYKGTDCTWKEIKSKLKKGDVAIEILSYRGLNHHDIYYDAYIVDSESKAPRLIPLCSEAQLKSLISDSIDYKRLSILIWGKEGLSDAIKDAKNIYFSTSGLLNTIGIEYLPIEGNQYIYNKYNLFRLSSTRELCIENDALVNYRVCLYGGLDYNNINEQHCISNTVPNKLSRSAIESLIKRGGFDSLSGSLEEIEQIKTLITKKGTDCIVYKGLNGTEESFKALSGGNIRIMHLSTHGMYVREGNDSVKDRNNFRFIMSEETPIIDAEEIVLSRSFLVMAGGNALIHRDSIPTEKEDGILTASEISHLDFTNLDLVVLSACETALGDIYDEGIYGLQRGFKKAGANTILMSLDKVDDEATRILMVEFYRNLMNGKTKRQSLQDAQQYLRKIDNGKYDDPKYWASFIMLDGLNY